MDTDNGCRVKGEGGAGWRWGKGEKAGTIIIA